MHISSLLVDPDTVEFSPEQQDVLRQVYAGENVFFTGPAGTGKSLLLRAIIAKLRPNRAIVNGVAITASTGIAGLNIGGITLHSFAGIGYGKEPVDILVKNIDKSRWLAKRWRTTDVLIIDEISMIDGTLFDKLEAIARRIRKSNKPFGGIQLILSGDFYQLPPVPEQSHQNKKLTTLAFDAKSWSRCILRPMFLKRVFRQTDNAFIGILTNMRRGIILPEDVQRLQALSRPLHYADGIEPSELFPLRADVDICNRNRLEALQGPEHTYHAMDSAGYDIRKLPISREDAQTLLDKVNTTPAIITLKIGAQVMLTKNLKEGRLVNGSIGKISGFLTSSGARNENIEIPEKAGVTDSKNAEIAFSMSMNDEMRPLTGHIFSRREKWPVVHFQNGDELLCTPQEFTVEGPLGNLEARRIQVPLILAWALSIHKSQGQTLDRVKINLANTFENGQAYVAISRARSMDGLELHNFDPSKVTVHRRVVNWHEFWESFGDGEWPEGLDDDSSFENSTCY